MIFILFVINLIASAKVIYVSEVIEFSSQYEDKSYSSNQVIGMPSNFVEYGSSLTAWRPEEEFSMTGEFIKVKFSEPMNAKRIIIYENFNPGAISEIIAFNTDLTKNEKVFVQEQFIYQDEIGKIKIIELTKPLNFRIQYLKIVLATNRIPGYNEIDAIALSDNLEDDVSVKINLSKNDFDVYEVENLGYRINSEYVELAPIISSNEEELFFTRKYHPDNIGSDRKQDIWYSKIDSEGNFSEAVNLGDPINDEYNNFAFSITPDGNSLLLGNVYLKDDEPSPGISITHRTANGWSFPEELSIEDIERTGKYSSYQLASDGQTLMISIENEESLGRTDLFVSFLTDSNKWSKPIHLGDKINSGAFETSPFLAADRKTLYFSTSGRPGYGNNDVFYTKRLDKSWKNWSEPINLGNKINSDGWDAYFNIPASGKHAYFVSTKNSIGYEDIFRIQIPDDLRPEDVILISGYVKDSKQKPLEAIIRYENLRTGEKIGKARTHPLTGKYQITLSKGENYGIYAEADDYIAVTYNIDLDSLSDYREINQDITMFPIKKGETIRINNIFFSFAEFELLPESFPELNRLVEILNKYPDLKIQINGHTDDVGADDRNLKLSLNRAKAVSDYLKNQGIDQKRLSIKGFGKTQPLINEKTEEARSQNRRVEFLILE
jgi:outer membrane protein OmpA-like peptidoglycan-associated protein